LVRILLLGLITKDRFVDHGMKNLLLPAVILSAKRLQLTSLLVLADEMTCTPAFTNLKRIVEKQVWFTSEVLPVVRVATLGFIVLSAEGAPLSFEEEHIEVLVAGHLVDQRRLYVSFSVGKGAVLLVLALAEGLGAELCFVLLNVVEALNLVVSKFAELVIALFVRAKFYSVVELSSTAALVRR